jgi:hypothetical protein
MFRSLTKYLSAGLLSVGLAVGSAGVAAGQTDDAGNRGGVTNNNTGGARGGTTATTDDDRGFNWGLLGLLGLAGLIPLFMRRGHDHHDHRHDTTTAGRGTARV